MTKRVVDGDANVVQIDNYLKRINYEGPIACDLLALRSIVFAHATTIPFEGLDALAGIPVSLDISAIEDKLVRRRRGGYCFEQNGLLGAALREIGFNVEDLSARVWYNAPPGVTPPRTHVFLCVTVEGTRWLADCGVGGSTPTGLLELDRMGAPQKLIGETRRIVPIEGRLVTTFMHQVLHGDHWADVYEFTGETMPKIDQEMGNWWTSSHADSKFRKNLIVARLNRDGTRYTLVNNEALHRRSDQVLERVAITDCGQLRELLQERFGLELPVNIDTSFLF